MAGRKKTADPGIPRTVNIPESMDTYLQLFMPTGSRSEYYREAYEFLRKIRPAQVVDGELQFVQHERTAPKPTVSKPRKAVRDYALAHGLTIKDAEAALIRKGLGL